MLLLRRLIAVLGLLGLVLPAGASTIDTIRLQQSPIIVVWDGAGEPVFGTQTVIAQRAHLRPVSLIRTGRLDPVDADQAVALATQQKQFRIASNAPFMIRAEASGFAADANGTFQLKVTDIGVNAQLPGPAATSERALSDLSAPVIVYSATRRTARARGSLASQSIGFDASWSGPATADVTLTIFAP